MRKEAIFRIRFITGFVIFLSLVLVGRLYQLQITKGAAYKAEGERQYVQTVQDLYERGSIYFTAEDGELVSAATIQAGYLLALDPSHLEDPEAAYTALNAIVPLDHDTFMNKTGDKSKAYVEIDQQVTQGQGDAISALKLRGVKLYRTQWRYYPGNNLAAHTIGFVGYEGNDLVGKYGLERYYEDTLKRNTEHLSVNFFAELFGDLGKLVFNSSDNTAGDIVTTIEPTVSRKLDDVLEEVQKQYHSNYTAGIIIDPHTGEVYALDVAPSFNLNDRTGVPLEVFRNPLVEDVHEFGSIVKALTMASGLDSGAVTPKSTYNDTGCVTEDTFTFCNYDGKARGVVDMQQVLSQSLNVGAAHVASLVGKERFRNYFTALGLGTESGIDLPSETHGLIKNLQSPRNIEYSTASFGQGIALTAIGTARALSTLANGGVLTTPHIAKLVTFTNGEKKDIGYAPGKQVFSAQATETLTRMLVTVVDTALKHGKVKKEHYSIAAKTGTAQIPDPVNGGYYKDRYLHSFFGYFPAYDPKFLIFLYTVEPKGVQYASETLTDPFMELVDFLTNYYRIPPDR